MAFMKSIYKFILGITLVFILTGCGIYGKLAPLSKSADMSLLQLETNWDDYHIYYNEEHGSRALIFDPKRDEKKITQNVWTKIEDPHLLAEKISKIRGSYSRSGLYIMLGPDGSQFGYVFCNNYETVVTKKVGENELLVFGLNVPPPPPEP